jgi:CelD/BcsL family acetyltransferase involved in cellulose biosynthesis
LLVGSVMGHNYDAVSGLLERRRARFEAAGAGDLLAELELRDVFESFLNVGDDGGG